MFPLLIFMEDPRTDVQESLQKAADQRHLCPPCGRAELSPQGSKAAKALRPKERDRGTDFGDGQTGCFHV